MAADQRRKRLNSSSTMRYNVREHYRAEKKGLGFLQNDANLSAHISVEWDRSKKKVVAKTEQIGIGWRDLRPFTDSAPNCPGVLADVISIPREIFELKNLKEVLTYEVWQTYLSENERNYLMNFLPRGSEMEQVVESLLSGDKFHFGNPFLKWGTSLCSGDLHPDAVLHHERCLRAEKNSYYLGIQNYHNDIIGYLLDLKERCADCKDPEKEIIQSPWRSRNDVEQRVSLLANECRFRDPGGSVTATSESSSWAADEKACSSDNQTSIMKGGELPTRASKKGFMKSRDLFVTSDKVPNVGAKTRKGDKVHKRNIQCSDGDKYMSYFKISKKQHQLVKNMKQSGKSIQSRSLNQVLGSIDGFHVQPYVLFVEEEQKKLQEHWLQLAKNHIPLAYANWREIHLQRRHITKLLEQDMKDGKKLSVDEFSENHESILEDLKDNEESDPLAITEDDESTKSLEQGMTDRQNLLVDEDAEHHANVLEDWKDNELTDGISSTEDDEESVPTSPYDQCQMHVIGGNAFNSMDLDSKNYHSQKSDTSHDEESGSLGNAMPEDVSASQGVPLSSAGDAMPAARIPGSYYDSSADHEDTSASGLSPAQSLVGEEQQRQLIDLESNLHGQDDGEFLMRRQADASTFGLDRNQDKTELLHPLFERQGMLSYHHEERRTQLNFEVPSSNLLEASKYSMHFQDQLNPSLLLDRGQKREDEIFVQQNASVDTYPNGGRYLVPRQEPLMPVNMQEWALGSVGISAPLQSGINGGRLVGQDWFSAGHQACSGWSGPNSITVPIQQIGSGGSADQSLFSVVSTQLHPSNSVGPTQQFISSRSHVMMSGDIPRMSTASLPQTSHLLDYLGGHDAATTSLIPNDMGWMGMQHQNSSLNDPMEKPYLRTWNQ